MSDEPKLGGGRERVACACVCLVCRPDLKLSLALCSHGPPACDDPVTYANHINPVGCVFEAERMKKWGEKNGVCTIGSLGRGAERGQCAGGNEGQPSGTQVCDSLSRRRPHYSKRKADHGVMTATASHHCHRYHYLRNERRSREQGAASLLLPSDMQMIHTLRRSWVRLAATATRRSWFLDNFGPSWRTTWCARRSGNIISLSLDCWGFATRLKPGKQLIERETDLSLNSRKIFPSPHPPVTMFISMARRRAKWTLITSCENWKKQNKRKTKNTNQFAVIYSFLKHIYIYKSTKNIFFLN